MDLKERIAALGTPGLASIDARPMDMELDSRWIEVPNPTVDDLENYGLDEDFDLETDYQAAVGAFKGSRYYKEWKEGFKSEMLAVWPVRLFQRSHQEVAQMLADLNLAVAIAKVPTSLEDYLDEFNALIVMTGGGTDLSNDIAQGYLACEQVPPTALLDGMGTSMMDRFYNEDMKALMGVAVRRAADYHRGRMERFEGLADKHFPEEGSAPRM